MDALTAEGLAEGVGVIDGVMADTKTALSDSWSVPQYPGMDMSNVDCVVTLSKIEPEYCVGATSAFAAVVGPS